MFNFLFYFTLFTEVSIKQVKAETSKFMILCVIKIDPKLLATLALQVGDLIRKIAQ